jgi:hypothetical protein
MNNTCIDMRTLDLNIYMYMKGKIYKNPELSQLYFRSSCPMLDAQIEQTEAAVLVKAGPGGGGVS